MYYRVTFYIEQIEDTDYAVVETEDIDIAETRVEAFLKDVYDGEITWIETAEDGNLYIDLLIYEPTIKLWY